MKIAIIGGGIAGLTCAYRLLKKGIKSILFEKEMIVGGRLQWSGVIGGTAIHPYTSALIKELGLEEVMVNLRLADMGAVLPDGNLIKMEDFPLMVQNFSPEETAFFQKLGAFFAKQSLDVKNPSPGITGLRDISFAEYMAECPEKLKPLLGFELNVRWIKDWQQISAEYGAICIAPFFTTIPKEEMYTFEENMIIITNVLAEKIKQAGGEVRTDTEVKKIEQIKAGFKIHLEEEGKLKTEKVEKVVLAVPLSVTEKIFPELTLKSGVKYINSKCILTRGEIRPEYDRKILLVSPGHPSNLCLIFAMAPEEHRVYPFDPNKEIDLSTIYKEFEILGERELAPAWPTIPPGASIPEMKTNMAGVYLCGDFYHFAAHDTAVATAETVADMINP